jgi:hypothetical protein
MHKMLVQELPEEMEAYFLLVSQIFIMTQYRNSEGLKAKYIY